LCLDSLFLGVGMIYSKEHTTALSTRERKVSSCKKISSECVDVMFIEVKN